MYEQFLTGVMGGFIGGVIGFVAGNAYRKHVQCRYAAIMGMAEAMYQETEAKRRLEASTMPREETVIDFNTTESKLTYQPKVK